MKAVSDKEIVIGSYSLETLTTGMYENPRHCLREYIQNAYDSIRSARGSGLLTDKDGLVSISITGSGNRTTLAIQDDGEGIPPETAVPTLVSVGASRKRSNANAGFRGIGRLAGIAYCTTLRFTTTTRGSDIATVVEFDCALMRSYMRPAADVQDVAEVIRLCVKSETRPTPNDDHGMLVEMVGLVGVGIEFAEIEDLIPYLRQVSPTDYSDRFSFADRIRSFCTSIGEPIGAIEVETRFKRERRQILKGYDDATSTKDKVSKIYDIQQISSPELGWHAWIGLSTFEGELTDNTVAGVRFRVKNIQVGSWDIIEGLAAGLTPGGTERRLQRWAVGEVFITNPAVVPNARRDGFEDSKEWREIKEDIRQRVAKRIVTLVRSASKSRRSLKTIMEETASLQRKVDAGPTDETAIRALIAASEKLLNKLASEKFSGLDPNDIGKAVSKVKGQKEALLEELGKKQSETSETSGTRGESTGTGGTGTPDSDTSQTGSNQTEEDTSDGSEDCNSDQMLQALVAVLVTEYGQTEADRLVELARESLLDD